MNVEYILATHNQNKVLEINHLLTSFPVTIKSLADINYLEEIIENGNTLEENAFIKAETIFRDLDKNALGEDTGLEVEALEGAPGVFTARYGGAQRSADHNMDRLLSELEGETNRKARFRTCIALITNDKRKLFEGIVEGEIGTEKKGDYGFGYDPIFIPDGYNKTFAELPLNEKSKISHRARAVKKLMEFLIELHNKI